MIAEVETLEGLEIREEVESCHCRINDKIALTGGKRNNGAAAIGGGGKRIPTSL